MPEKLPFANHERLRFANSLFLGKFCFSWEILGLPKLCIAVDAEKDYIFPEFYIFFVDLPLIRINF